jgi:hypothetical protein
MINEAFLRIYAKLYTYILDLKKALVKYNENFEPLYSKLWSVHK